MTTPEILQAVRDLVQTPPLTGVRVDRFEIVDEVAELSLSFQAEVLENVLASELASTGGPADWSDPRAPMEEGSPTWAYAGGIAALLHHGYFNQTILAQHEAALHRILAEHGHPETPVTATATYTPAELMVHYRRLKAEHLKHLSTPQG